jgi:hypothetical protein
MGKIHVEIDADVGGKESNFKFSWEGDDAEVQRILNLVQARSDAEGCAPMVLAKSVLRHLPTMGWMSRDKGGQYQRALILYLVLNMNVSNKGPLHQFAANEDTDVVLTVDSRQVTVEIHGAPTSRLH